MIKTFIELNCRWVLALLLAGFFVQMVGLSYFIAPSPQLPSGEACLVETELISSQQDQSSDPTFTGVVSRKCHLVIVSPCFMMMAKEFLLPFQISLLETGRSLGGCGEN